MSSPQSAAPQSPKNPARGTAPAATPPLWLRRISLVTFVTFCVWIGMLLVALPWTRIWTENSLLTGSPTLRAFTQSAVLRGAVSGLGFIDIWLGIWEALHYRESH
ncbi:MAG: hypothetical protein ACRD2K_03020 [Terriglobales bacterium]